MMLLFSLSEASEPKISQISWFSEPTGPWARLASANLPHLIVSSDLLKRMGELSRWVMMTLFSSLRPSGR